MILAAAGVKEVLMIVGYIVIFGALLYFVAIRPQKMETGDSVLTTSGFYGVIIDITDDTVIVEFGSNKNCRIPMQKSAIVQIEKAQ